MSEVTKPSWVKEKHKKMQNTLISDRSQPRQNSRQSKRPKQLHKSPHNIRRQLSPELLSQIRAESHGRAYVQKQIRRKTPMVFELYGGRIEGIINRRLTYTLVVLADGETHHLEKLNIKYMYKKDEMSHVVQDIEVEAGLKTQNLVSIVHKSERFQVDDRVLARCRKEKIPVRLTLRGGEIITGVIAWFSHYEMKMLLAHGGSVVVFRHGLQSFAISPRWARNAGV